MTGFRETIRRWLPQIHPAVFTIVGLCVAIEFALALSDYRLLDIPRFRSLAYEFGGFWPGVLNDWAPNYPLQPWTMFVTYGFLHSGFLHLIVNMLTLTSLGAPVIHRVGVWKFVLIYSAALLGGAAGFALLSDTFRPMVGASGALFGLAGAILAWEYVDRFNLSERLWPVVRAIVLIVALNVVLYYAMNRLLAWEAHLGGFAVGWIAAMLVDPRSRMG